MPLNIDMQRLALASGDQLEAFHLEEQLPELASGLQSGKSVYYKGRILSKTIDTPADSSVPSYKELDVVLNKVDELRKSGRITETKGLDSSIDTIRQYAEVSRVTDGESKQELAIETTLVNPVVDNVAIVLGTIFK